MTTNALRRVAVTNCDRVGTSDYAAAWEIAVAGPNPRPAEGWARAIFEEAPAALRRFIVAGWIAGLGLRLGPRGSRAHVLGWEIVSPAEDRMILHVRSLVLGHAYFVLCVDDRTVLLTSFVRYEKPWAGAVWSFVKPLHHRIVPYLLTHAVSHWAGAAR